MIVVVSWPLGVGMLCHGTPIPLMFLRIVNPWFLLPAILALVLGCRVMFLAGEAVSTCRRSWGNAWEGESPHA